MYQDNSIILQGEVSQICNICMALGIHKNVYNQQTTLLSHMPVSLYPYELSKSTYQKLRKAHLIWVKLLVKVSKDRELVNRVFEQTAKSDPFVRRFLQLYNKHVESEDYGVTSIRIDYMGDQHPQLVEYNLMSVGLNGMSDAVQRLAALYQKHRTQQKIFYPESRNQVTLLNAIQTTLTNEKLPGLVVMVVHEKHQKQFNFGDQNAFQLQALKRQLKVKRVSMSEFISGYRMSQKNDLYLNEDRVGLVYFRTAYSPDHYTSEKHWELREAVEKANVLSIPSVSMQLINFKRMQVQLSKLEVLKHQLPQEQAELIKSLTGQLYDFEDPTTIPKLKQLSSSGNFVLKSNRQGGGNNYFGIQAMEKIQEFSHLPGELSKYILQNKIKSTIQQNVFIANYRYLEVKQCTSQYSTFGAFAWNKEELIVNECNGHLVRLKRAEQNQGGIAIDKAVMAGVCVLKGK